MITIRTSIRTNRTGSVFLRSSITNLVRILSGMPITRAYRMTSASEIGIRDVRELIASLICG